MTAEQSESTLQRARSAFTPTRMTMLRTVGADHFWFGPRERLLRRLALGLAGDDAAVLDVGCGAGDWLSTLSGDGCAVHGTDIWPDGPAIPRLVYRVGTADALPWADGRFSLVSLLDVIEHLDDDVAALREAYRVLTPGGWLLVSVPAWPALWSERDVRAGHRRRYTSQALRKALDLAGFMRPSLQGYQFFLLPVLMFSRWLGRRRAATADNEERPPRWANAALRFINNTEVACAGFMRWPVGSSLVAVAQKPTSRTVS